MTNFILITTKDVDYNFLCQLIGTEVTSSLCTSFVMTLRWPAICPDLLVPQKKFIENFND